MAIASLAGARVEQATVDNPENRAASEKVLALEEKQ